MCPSCEQGGSWQLRGGALPHGGSLSSLQVMYFSSLFPYVVLACFLVRGLLLRGAIDGILHMFTPKVGIHQPQVARGMWRTRCVSGAGGVHWGPSLSPAFGVPRRKTSC